MDAGGLAGAGGIEVEKAGQFDHGERRQHAGVVFPHAPGADDPDANAPVGHPTHLGGNARRAKGK